MRAFPALERVSEAPTWVPAPDIAAIKAHLRIAYDAEDDLLQRYAEVAAGAVESAVGYPLQRATWRMHCPDAEMLAPWSMGILLPGYVHVDTVSVQWLDNDGAWKSIPQAETTVVAGEPKQYGARVFTSYERYIEVCSGLHWYAPYVLRVEFDRGWPEGGIPADMEHAVLLLVGEWFANREAASAFPRTSLPMGVSALLAPYRETRL